MDEFTPVEYKVVHFEEIETLEGDGFEVFLNDLGAKGWDLTHASRLYMVFKRS